MNIFIYWNRKDNDSKKMFKFLKDGSWINALKDKYEVVDLFPHTAFKIENCRIHLSESVEISLLDAIEQADILMFFTHGEDDRILKYRYKFATAKKEFSLIDCDMSSIVSGKAIISMCCSSAQSLGPHCVKSEGAPYFIGFEKPLVYDQDDIPNQQLRAIVYKAYSSGFDKVFEAALEKQYTADKLVKRLKLYLNKSITEGILSSPERSMEKYTMGVPFYEEGINSLVCLGNQAQVIFN